MSDLGLTAENVRLALLFLQASLRYHPNGLIPTRFLVAFCPVTGGAALAGEMAGKFRQQGGVQIGHRHRQAQIDQRCDAVVANAAGHDAGKMA